eukprot:TRINITY_DN48858_c0_g1_i1.p1 TRINITY_DN48858_c0_g1~~TRINITY_DN48858_c0_g1_i1.p1  ORF type:complete len:486 (+),score=41.75 TRINITY_DN48858_c0_g1_i1:208-1665(+)
MLRRRRPGWRLLIPCVLLSGGMIWWTGRASTLDTTVTVETRERMHHVLRVAADQHIEVTLQDAMTRPQTATIPPSSPALEDATSVPSGQIAGSGAIHPTAHPRAGLPGPGCVVTVGHCQNVEMANGFGSILLAVMTSMALCEKAYPGQPVHVRWNSFFSTYCPRSPGVNCWEHYFEPSSNRPSAANADVCVAHDTDISDRCSELLEYHESASPPAEPLRKTAAVLIGRRLRVRRSLKRRVDQLWEELGLGGNTTVIGVHLRGTDHAVELPGTKLLPLADYIHEVETLLESVAGACKIFVASDSQEGVDVFKKRFGEQVVSAALKRPAQYEPLRVVTPAGGEGISEEVIQKFQNDVTLHTAHYSSDTSPLEKGEGVLFDMLLLGRCHHLVHYISSVALFVMLMNPAIVSHPMSVGSLGTRHLQSLPASRFNAGLRPSRRKHTCQYPTLDVCPSQQFLRMVQPRNEAEATWACPFGTIVAPGSAHVR